MSGQTQASVSFVKVSFDPDPGFELSFDGLSGAEELGRPFLFHVNLSTGTWKGDVQKLVGTKVTIKWVAPSSTEVQGDSDDRYVNGIVTRMVSRGLQKGGYGYSAEVRPWVWLLSQVEDCRIFQNMSAFDIIVKVFRDAGFSDFEDKRKSSSGSTTLEYCVQYRESSLDFVQRLMEEYGIYYFFRHNETSHTLVFADDPNSHEELSSEIPFKFDRTETRAVEDHVWEWSSDFTLHSGKYTVRDYNFTTPSADLTAKSVKPGAHSNADNEVYEYPGPYGDTGLGQQLADIRMQAIAAQRAMYHGVSNSRKLHKGWKFTLKEHPAGADMNKTYLLVRSEIMVGLEEGMSSQSDEGEKRDTYRVTLTAIPSTVTYRLLRHTKKPMIRGPQTAKVMGESGSSDPYTDQYGRVKVKFYWDRDEETSDSERTCWIRVAQAWGGAGWGFIAIPRPGMEVVVEFLEGNPDRPLITGVVYNASQTVPYDLPTEKWKSTLKSNTSNSGFNEIRMDDTAGSEQFYFHAEKDYVREVKHDQTVTVTNNHTTTVSQGNHSTTVSQGNHSTTVSQGNHSTTVSQGNHTLTVSTGNHTITISAGKSEISAPQSITLTSAGSSIKVSPTGVEISGPTIKIGGETMMQLDGGATMTLSAGMISIN